MLITFRARLCTHSSIPTFPCTGNAVWSVLYMSSRLADHYISVSSVLGCGAAVRSTKGSVRCKERKSQVGKRECVRTAVASGWPASPGDLKRPIVDYDCLPERRLSRKPLM